MKQYLDLVERVLTTGKKKSDPQKIGNLAVLGHEMRFRPAEEFPLITVRSLKGSWKAIVHELLWFLSGSSRVEDLHKYNVHLWDVWANEETCKPLGLETGDLGPIYGPQWRRWKTRTGGEIDQIQREVLDVLKTNPDSRRLMVTPWNPEDLNKVFIVPCHGPFKFFHAEGELSLHVFHRSADTILGVPFDIAEYALLLLMVAQVTGFRPAELVTTLSDTHIYFNHLEVARELLSREPRPLPRVTLNPDAKDLFNFKFEDFTLENYDPHPPIKGIPVGY